MKKQNFIGGGKQPVYAAPTVETIEFSAEQGFAASPLSTYDDINGGLLPGGPLDDPFFYLEDF